MRRADSLLSTAPWTVRAVLDNPAKSYDEALWKSWGRRDAGRFQNELTPQRHRLPARAITPPSARGAISTVRR